jgi:hypothetical protein
MMKNKVGLWIDHAKAVVVTMTSGGEETLSILSEVEKQPRREGGEITGEAFEALQVPADDSRQRRLSGQLNVFYDTVIASVNKADAVLILGPSQAKGELKKRMEKEGLGERVVALETTGYLTDKQISAKIREYFKANPILNQKRAPVLSGKNTGVLKGNFRVVQ